MPLYAQDIGSWYTQYKTARAYQAGDIPSAHALYTDVVKANPQDPLVNFNEGFLLYKQGDYAQAAASFERAAQSATGDQQQEAYFNLGNAKAYQKEWQQAIDAYDKILEQNPAHERAKHNKEIVRKLLEQEKQQQKDDQQKQNDKQDQQDKNKDKNNSQDKQSQKSDNQQQKSPKEKQETGDTPEQQKDQQQGNQGQGNDKGNDAEQTADKHQQERSDKMNQEKQRQEEKAQEQKHTSPSKNKSDYKTSSAGEQGQEQNKEKDEIAQLLEQVDQKDTQQAKRLMHALLAQPKGGQYENKPSW